MCIKWIIHTILFVLSFLMSVAQPPLKEVAGLPTKELYDLYVDRKGYLWIAHDLGMSRFDGLNYTHFSCAAQASLSVSGITEDNEGRIWCHNFSGQIFYIEKGQMHLLRSYDYIKESKYPRLVICGDELLATSDHGLFICSTIDLKAQYVPVAAAGKWGNASLSVVGRNAVLFDNKEWYTYNQDKGLKKIGADTTIDQFGLRSSMLQPGSFGNLLFLVSNTRGIVQKLLFRNDSVKLLSSYKTDDLINTVSVGEQTWIHSKSHSRTLDGKWTITGQSLTDAVIDKEGNTWFSSLKKGLSVSYKKAQWNVIATPLEKEDFVRCFNATDGYFFAGTNQGNLLVFDSALKKITWKKRLFDGYGAIEFIRFYKDHQFVVGSSAHTYIVNPVGNEVKKLVAPASIKDVDFDNNSLYLASSNGLCMIPYPDSTGSAPWQQTNNSKYSVVSQISDGGNFHMLAPGRTRAIRYERKTGNLYASLKNGLHQIDGKGVHLFEINGRPVFVSSLWYREPRLFIGTFNDGLWIKDGNKLRHLTTGNFLSSNTILRTKATLNHLWLFQNETIQVMDLNTEKLVTNLQLPKINGANVFDVAEWNGFAFLTTEEGIYKIPMNNMVYEGAPAGFLDAVIVNDSDTLHGNASDLSYQHNNLQFILSSPSFYDPATTTFRYRMQGTSNDWQNTKPGERIIRYVSLPPGHYTFEAFAINKKGWVEDRMIRFEVDINKPWWQRWWFFILLLGLFTGFVYLFEKNRLQQLMKVEKVRRTISSDLHDDIGATLSSINIYTELAKKERDNGLYLDSIQQHSQEVTGKLDDLIWSINPRNDSFEKLISRMHNYAIPVLQAKGIVCSFQYNESLLKEKLQVQVKQNLYLILKELVNNVVKHSEAKNCFIHLDCRSNLLLLCVKDDGKGYDHAGNGREGNGIQNVKERVDNIHGHMEIVSAPGEGTSVTIYRSLFPRYSRFFKKLIS